MNMKKLLHKYLVVHMMIIFFLPVVSCYGSNIKKEKVCGVSDFQCMKYNFTLLYKNEYDLFWKILHFETNQIKNNPSVDNIKNYLELTNYIGGKSEVTEFFTSTIEFLIFSNTELFLDAMNNISGKTLKLTIFYLKNPYDKEPDDIDTLLRKYKNKDKYKYILSVYFNEYEKIVEEMLSGGVK